MKYKVLEKFTDKYTKQKYVIGEIIEISNERADEILSVGKLIEKVNEIKTEKATKSKKKK